MCLNLIFCAHRKELEHESLSTENTADNCEPEAVTAVVLESAALNAALTTSAFMMPKDAATNQHADDYKKRSVHDCKLMYIKTIFAFIRR